MFGEKTEETPAKEAGRLNADLHLSFLSSKSNPPVLSPAL